MYALCRQPNQYPQSLHPEHAPEKPELAAAVKALLTYVTLKQVHSAPRHFISTWAVPAVGIVWLKAPGVAVLRASGFEAAAALLRGSAEGAKVAALHRFFQDSLHVCSCCRTHGYGKKCSRCRKAFFCSVECQTREWPAHKAHCTAPAPGAA
ncbi:hypothetical protein WJX81_005576 [Elliptochloris bilobata]|uniref:MYND-type domain-containing protein n=1 Tax=Elliptochloris bilobata TaxID=381761 RepID=A0AAW1SEX0_9CHLO